MAISNFQALIIVRYDNEKFRIINSERNALYSSIIYVGLYFRNEIYSSSNPEVS